MLAEYGVDLGEALWGDQQFGVRKICALINNLPAGSPLHRALDPESWEWTIREELLAVLVEQIDLGNRMYYMANVKEGTPTPDPIVITRPGTRKEEPAPPVMSSPEAVRSFFKGKTRVKE